MRKVPYDRRLPSLHFEDILGAAVVHRMDSESFVRESVASSRFNVGSIDLGRWTSVGNVVGRV